MRLILVCLCVFSIGCSGEPLKSPTSPTAAANVSTTSSLASHALPFRGSLTAKEIDIVTFPTLHATGAAEGTATHLGLYAAEFNATVNLLDGTATGSFTFTTADGDRLFSTLNGLGVGEPIANITETLTITGGTGRLAGATGTLVVRRTLDLTTGESSGTIEGGITMQH